MTSEANRTLFVTMLDALGRKDFDRFEACLADDVLLEWPFPVMEGFPLEARGARWFRESLEASWVDFAPYAYRIAAIHDMADPEALVAEYTSHSTYLPTGQPYENAYVAVIEFADGRISRWREYLNPQVIARTLAEGSSWSADKGAAA
jgi:ketosteroid isomerase-like protein